MDALDLIEHINYNGGKQVDYAYNKTGDLVKMEDWSGTTTYEVDLLHQLTATTDRLGKHVAYTYDGVGNQTSVAYPDGTTATKEYDLVHNLTTVIEEDGRTTSYTYDGMRRVTHMNYPDGWQEDYHYDSIGQLLAIEDTDPTQKDMKQQKNTFEYDVCGNMIHEYMRGNGTGETTTDVTYTYDELHRVTSAHELYGNTWREYQYDSLSNLTYESNSNNVHYDYKLNNLNQLVQKSYSSNDKEGTLYTYDKRGNLVLEEYGKLNGSPNGQKRQTVAEYTYDETNKMVKGVNSIGESSSYLFNGRNALVEQTWHIAKNGYGYHDVDAGIEDPADTTNGKGGNGSGGKGHGNGNGQGNGNGSGDKPTGTTVGDFSTVVKQFVIDYTVETMDPLMEHEVNGLDYRYVYGNERLSVNISPIPNGAGHIVESGTVGQQIRLYYHQDLRGTVDYLTSPVSQKVESWTHYNEWGEITHNAVLKTGYRELDLVKNYTGHDFDAVLNMYYAKARMYDAENRRFVGIDPILDGSKFDLSEYTNDPVRFVQYPYVRDNPLIYVDPLGLREFEDDPKEGFVSKKTAQENKYAAQAAKQPVLQYGRTGNDVYELQRKLANAGYYHYTEIDGSFGPKTDAAVREFQKINGLDVDGSVGPKTWTKLLAETYKQGPDKQDRHSNQQLLNNESKQMKAMSSQSGTTKPSIGANNGGILQKTNNTPMPEKSYMSQYECPNLLKQIFGAGYTEDVLIYERPIIDLFLVVATIKSGVKEDGTLVSVGDSSKPISVYAKQNVTHPIKSSSAGAKINVGDVATLQGAVSLDNTSVSGAIHFGDTTYSLALKLNISALELGIEGSSTVKNQSGTRTTQYGSFNITGVGALMLVLAAMGGDPSMLQVATQGR